MKSVTIKSGDKVLVRVTHHKNGKYSCITAIELDGKVHIDVRDDENKAVYFVREK